MIFFSARKDMIFAKSASKSARNPWGQKKNQKNCIFFFEKLFRPSPVGGIIFPMAAFWLAIMPNQPFAIGCGQEKSVERFGFFLEKPHICTQS
jgi:hypothetical protein